MKNRNENAVLKAVSIDSPCCQWLNVWMRTGALHRSTFYDRVCTGKRFFIRTQLKGF
jgi:hypothetical protein